MSIKEKIIINLLLVIFIGLFISGITIYLISKGKNNTVFLIGITLSSFYFCFYCYYLHFRLNKKEPKKEKNKKTE